MGLDMQYEGEQPKPQIEKKERKPVRVIGLDPGKQRDSFAIVGIELKDDRIYVKNAIRFLGKKYLEVEDWLERFHQEHRYQYYILELNNTGHHVYEVLAYQKRIPVFPVTTTKDVKDLEKKNSIKTMDKNEMVRTMANWFVEGYIVFPNQSNPEIDELKRQLSIFAEHKTEAGNVSYYVEGSEHDDLVMALMLACFWIKKTHVRIIKV